MHPRTILAIARKDAIDILLNRSTLMVLLMPIMLAVLFQLISIFVGGHATGILVYNPGNSPLVQVVSKSFDRVAITPAGSPEDVTAAFGPNGSRKDSPYDVGLIIPAGFEASLQAGQHPQVSLYLNGNNINNQNSLLIQEAIANYARQVASPQAPVALTTAMINPPTATNVGELLSDYYGVVALVMSLIVGTSLMPGLLIEEKERKTLRMLMVTPASFADVVLGKLLVTLVYQLVLSTVAMSIQHSFIGQVPFLLLYMLLGALFSISLGALLGGMFQNASTAGAVGGMLTFIYLIPIIFAGPVGTLIGNNPLFTLVKILPTYYLADGTYKAIQNQVTFSGHLLDIGVLLGCILVLIGLATWVLRRQASIAASV